jgi:hypothetical protein
VTPRRPLLRPSPIPELVDRLNPRLYDAYVLLRWRLAYAVQVARGAAIFAPVTTLAEAPAGEDVTGVPAQPEPAEPITPPAAPDATLPGAPDAQGEPATPTPPDGGPEEDDGEAGQPQPGGPAEPPEQEGAADKLVFRCKACGVMNNLVHPDVFLAAPVRAPMFAACQTCEGLGRVDTGSLVGSYAIIECPTCHGAGYVDTATGTAPATVPAGEPPWPGAVWNPETGAWA